MADWLFKKTQLSRSDIDFLMDAFAAFRGQNGGDPPFRNYQHMHETLDAIEHRDAPWKCITAQYQEPIPEANALWWITEEYEIWTRNTRTMSQNMLNNPDFKKSFYTDPYHKFNAKGEQVFFYLMSANWSW